MIRTIPSVAFAATLASCTPMAETLPSQVVEACQRQDVQDVVGKEARNMMLKANEDRLWKAALFGINMAEAVEQARVTFSEVGVLASEAVQSPYSQIICQGSMQIDGSSAQAGQDIVTMPRLRWSINFAQPTDNPAAAAFSIAIDPASLFDGVLVNGQQPEASRQKTDATPPQEATEVPANSETRESEADPSLADAEAALAEAEADAKIAATFGEDAESTNRQPSDEDLYAPHGN